MSLSRRHLLRLGGGLGAAAAAAGFGPLANYRPGQTGTLLTSRVPLPEPFRQPLTIPTVARAADGLIEITQRVADLEILPGRRTRVFGYDGTFPGPTLALRRGQPTRVHVRSKLPIATAVHLHGGRTPSESDGFPTDLLLPPGHQGHPMGGTTTVGKRDYTYPVDQPAATLWYHDHAMDFTGPNVYAGLAGFCLIGDDVDDELPLPRGERDLPLMICDRAFDGDAQFLYPALSPKQRVPGVDDDYLGGVLGDVVLVNGVPWPVHDVAAAKYRLRLLNGSNARRYQLVLDPPAPLTRIGADVGLLGKPVKGQEITLAPAERAEVIVDFAAYPVGTRVTVCNALGSGSTADVMRFVVARKEPDDAAIPEVLAPTEPLSRVDAVAVREFHFSMRRATGRDTGHGDHRWTINGKAYDPKTDLATPRLGDVEVWRFMTNVHHPVHLHLAHFQVLNRNGGTPGPNDLGPKDTVDLLPGEACEVITRFTGYRGRYVLHCHNLEHEDMAMMANFSVV